VAGGGDAYAAGIVALALAFHRVPTQHADLLHGPASLPPGVGVLLKLAGGSDPDPAWLALAPADELRAAALFFIEQVLFRRDASHYRVLGLATDATPEQIKEHHRLLMRVFHPDREDRTDDWKDAFATRINLAYTALRDSDERRRYDAALTPAGKPATTTPARHPSAHPHPPARPRRGAGLLPPFVLRHLPQWVLAGSALVAAAVVGVVYLSNPQPAPANEPPLTARPAQRATAAAAMPARAPDIALAAVTGPHAPAETKARAPASPSPAPAPAVPAPAPDAVRAQAEVAAPPPRLAAPSMQADRPAAPIQAQASPAAAPPNPPPALKIAPSLEASRPAALESPNAPSPGTDAAPERPPAPDPDATLARFMSSYERGDTQALMALFDEVAIGAAGGKPQIRREHESLFKSTDLRHLAIERMTWRREGDWVLGEGRYRATQMRKGEQWLRTETGTIRIELLQRGGEALIMGLDYLPGERS
jgi:hypothetical protein